MSRIIEAFEQFFDGDGNPLTDGWLKFTESGTNLTDKDTYADTNLTIANTNPLQLDSEGRCPNVFGTGSYRVTLYTDDDGSPGVQIDQKDPVGGISGTFTIGDWNSTTTYLLNSLVIYDNDYYKSLVSGNLNNIPSAKPASWEHVDYVHFYNSSISYDEFESVIDPANGLIYISLSDSNLGHTPNTSPLYWENQGLINEADIATNTADIATNTADIATNTADIATNTSDISDLQSDKMDKSSNLSDVADTATARTNLDVYSKTEVDELVFPVGSLIEHYGDNPDTDIYAESGDTVSDVSYPLIKTILPPVLTLTQRTPSGTPPTVFRAAYYGGGLHVIGGSNGNIQTSDDGGATWTLQTGISTIQTFYDGTYGNGTHILVGSGGEIQTSNNNGVTWVKRTPDASFTGAIWGVAYNPDDTRFIIVGGGGEIQTSDDNGASWTHRDNDGSTSSDFQSVTYYDGLAFLCGQNTKIQTSDDGGVTWTAQTGASGFTGGFLGSSARNDVIIICGSGGEIQTSNNNGVTWIRRTTPTSNYLYSIAESNGSFIIAGSDVLTCGNPDDYEQPTPDASFTGTFYGVASDGENVVMVGQGGEIQTGNSETRKVPTFSTSQTGFTQYMRIA